MKALEAATATLSRGGQLAARRVELAGEADTLRARREALERQARSQVQPVEAALEDARPLVGLGLVSEGVFEAARREALVAFERLMGEVQPVEARLSAIRMELSSIEADAGFRAAERQARAEAEARSATEQALALAKAGRFADAERLLAPIASDLTIPPDLRRRAQGYRDEIRHLAAMAEADARLAAERSRTQATQRARVATRRGVRAWRAGRFAEAERLLAPLAGDEGLPDDLRRQARGLLWQAWLSESEAMAQPGDERYTVRGGLFLLREGVAVGVWGQAPYSAGARVSTLPQRARRKPWPAKVAARFAPARAAAPALDAETVFAAVIEAVAEVTARAAAADLEAAVVKPAACAAASLSAHAGAPDTHLRDFLAKLLAAGYEVDLDDREEATVVLVQTPDGREVTVEARLRRKAVHEQQRLRAEKLVRDLCAGLGAAPETDLS